MIGHIFYDIWFDGIIQALTFYNCRNSRVKNMKIQDSEHVHLTFEKCTNVNATNLSITALEKSLNINGFHVTNIQHVHIFNSTIGTDTLLLLLLLQPYLIKHKPSSFSIECYVVPFLLILSLILLLLCNQIKLIGNCISIVSESQVY